MKFTQNQQLVISALISMILTAIAAACTAVVQAHSGNGQLNIATLINVAVISFGATFSIALYNYVPAHIEQELEALRDTQTELQQIRMVPPAAPVVAEPISNIIVPPPEIKS